MKKGTLELLVFMPMDGEMLDYAFALSWRGAPTNAAWGAPYVSDLDLGDSECAALPEVPKAPGLWLLKWDWTEKKDEDGFDDCKYAKECRWWRPTHGEIASITYDTTEAR